MAEANQVNEDSPEVAEWRESLNTAQRAHEYYLREYDKARDRLTQSRLQVRRIIALRPAVEGDPE